MLRIMLIEDKTYLRVFFDFGDKGITDEMCRHVRFVAESGIIVYVLSDFKNYVKVENSFLNCLVFSDNKNLPENVNLIISYSDKAVFANVKNFRVDPSEKYTRDFFMQNIFTEMNIA